MTALQTAVLDLAAARELAFAGGQGGQPRRADRRGLPGARRLLRGHPGLRAGRRDRRARRRARRAPVRDLAWPPAPARPCSPPCPPRSPRRSPTPTRRSATGRAGGGAVVGHRRGPARRELRRPAGHLPERRRRRGACSTRCAAAGRRCGRTAPSPTAPTRASTHAEVALAVVVQRMVDAQVAGVLFTADPVSGRRTRSVIDAEPGARRGRRVRGGRPRPLRGRATARRRPAARRQAVDVRPAGGGTERVGSRPTPATVRDAASDARAGRVEAHFGAPQDIEWALDAAGALWLTQSRPITTLYPGAAVARRRRPARATSAPAWRRA